MNSRQASILAIALFLNKEANAFSLPRSISHHPRSRSLGGVKTSWQSMSSSSSLFMASLPQVDINSASPEQIETLVRSEYDKWVSRFGKSADEQRYQIFKQNFVTQLEYDQQTGVYHGLNEYGDLTAEEFEALTSQVAPVVTNQQVDAKIRQEYQAWAQQNPGKNMSEERFEVFKENFLTNMKHYQETGDYHVLNEFADMTLEEFEQVRMIEGTWIC